MSPIFEGEKLIAPSDYTPQIWVHIQIIKNRMDQTLVEYSEDDIKVFETADSIYILANPVVGEEPIYDDFGNVVELVPAYNITIQFPHPAFSTEVIQTISGGYMMEWSVKKPKLRIFRPELCLRIVKNDNR